MMLPKTHTAGAAAIIVLNGVVENPVIWHGAGANPGVFIPET